MIRRIATLAALIALTALGFVVRSTNAASVFVAGHVIFPENDPYYHMHRILETLRQYPHVPYYDKAIDYPYGGPIIWPPGFDFLLATASRAAGLGAQDRSAVETLSSLLIPLLGGLTCVPVYALACQVLARPWALLAAGLAVLVPAHAWYSRLGMVDHHVAATWLLVALLAVLLRACAALDEEAAGSARGWRAAWPWAAASALALGVGPLVWNGFLLFAAIVDLFLVLAIAVAPPGTRVRLAVLAGSTHVVAALLLLPFVRATVAVSGEPFSPLMLSWLDVAVLGGAGGLALAFAGLERAVARRADDAGAHERSRNVGSMARFGAFVALGALSLGFALWQRAAIGRAFEWLLASDPFMASVQEVVPILRGADGGYDLGQVAIWMTLFFFAVPAMLAALLLHLYRTRARDRGAMLLCVWSGCLFVLALEQRRFGETFAPALAVLAAWTLAALERAARVRFARAGLGRGAARAASLATMGALVAAAFAPYYGPLLRDPKRLTGLVHLDRDRAVAAAAAEDTPDWLTHRAAARFRDYLTSRGELAASVRSAAFGVMNPWPIGHKLIHVAGVPAASTPFGAHARPEAFADWSDFFLATDEARGVAILERRRLRYVAVDADLAPIGSAVLGRGENPRDYYGKDLAGDGALRITPHAPLIRTLYYRLAVLAGSEARLETDAPETVPALERLRMVLDSTGDRARGAVKFYELVPGARLEVLGPPDAAIELSYSFRSDTGRERIYRRSFLLDASGRARVTVPYSSERADLAQTSSYEIAGRDSRASVRVPEAAVQGGATIGVRLRAEPSSRP